MVSFPALSARSIGGALHSACRCMVGVRPEIGNRVIRVPQPRRPKTGSGDGRLHVLEPVTPEGSRS
jgi:hypothetical protein